MEWFDKDFFKALEMVGLVKVNEDFKKMMNEPTSEELKKDRDYWKELFEKEHETNKKLTNIVNKLTDYIGWSI